MLDCPFGQWLRSRQNDDLKGSVTLYFGLFRNSINPQAADSRGSILSSLDADDATAFVINAILRPELK
jgi:hypothetical protein